jgi:hypothetical protein
MASNRHYKRPKGYFQGGAVIPDEQRVEAPEPAVAVPEAAPSPPDDNPLQRALDAQQRAEEMQRQAAMPRSIKEQIAELEQIDRFRHQAAMFHHQAGLGEGIADESPEMEQRILAGIAAEVKHLHDQAAANVATRSPALMPPAPNIRRDAPPNVPAAPIMPPRKANIPYAAPPSRDVPSYSGKRENRGTMTLTPEEIRIARNSFTAPDMSNRDKELSYARNKMRLKRMRDSGEYPERESN